MIIVILTELNVQLLNDVTIPDRELNELRGDAISLGTVFVCDVTQMKYWRKYFKAKNYIMMILFWKETLKVVIMRVNAMKNKFSIPHNCLCFSINIFKIFSY